MSIKLYTTSQSLQFLFMSIKLNSSHGLDSMLISSAGARGPPRLVLTPEEG